MRRLDPAPSAETRTGMTRFAMTPSALTSAAPSAASPPARGDASAAAGAPMIRIDALGFRYGARAALEEVSFDVPRGALFGLLGPDGSGKTTFFRILSTALRPGSGGARLDG